MISVGNRRVGPSLTSIRRSRELTKVQEKIASAFRPQPRKATRSTKTNEYTQICATCADAVLLACVEKPRAATRLCRKGHRRTGSRRMLRYVKDNMEGTLRRPTRVDVWERVGRNSEFNNSVVVSPAGAMIHEFICLSSHAVSSLLGQLVHGTFLLAAKHRRRRSCHA